MHARQQALAMVDTTTAEVANLTLLHEGSQVRDLRALPLHQPAPSGWCTPR